MTQDQDVYRKVGRGGAGNYHTAKPADPSTKDLEAQELSTTVADPQPHQGQVRAGRGGAGNFVDPATAHEREKSSAAATVAATSSAKPQPVGYSGRGGAGNWKLDDGKAKEQEQRDKGRVEEVERSVLEAVESGLKMPEKVFTAPNKRKD